MTEWFLRVVEDWGYLGIVLLMALENVVPPVPSEVIMGFGGIAVARGKMDFVALVVAGTIGSTLGNCFWYELGRRLGLDRLRPVVERHGRWLTVDWSDVERIDAFFRRHGQWLVFAVRFAPVMRTMISLPAGVTHMNRWTFLAFTAAGTTIWNIFLVGAGWWLGENFRRAEAWMGPTALVLCGLGGLYYLWRVATWRPRG
ncbi:DedA family protein [uncultured Sphingomonas sp.]|uniref:DedA family protein n=1 Tax=uncultured Sphingomonas sp. TaxID=158754 RepID=UPI0035CB9AE8